MTFLQDNKYTYLSYFWLWSESSI